MSGEFYLGESVFDNLRKAVERGDIRHSDGIVGIPVHKLPGAAGSDAVYLVNREALASVEPYRFERDDMRDASMYAFYMQARLRVRYHDDLRVPSRWRDKVRESWRLYRQSVREGWRGLDPHEPDPEAWRQRSERTLTKSVCMIAGHKVEWPSPDFARCRECGSTRRIPDAVSLLGVTSTV